METLLMVAVVLITLAVIAQAGVLIAMYLMSRRIGGKVETLMNDSRRIMSPLESATSNLKTVADDLSETGKIARQQVLHVQDTVTEAQQLIRGQIVEVREVIQDRFDEARDIVMPPIRQYAAMASAVAEGLRTFFGGPRETTETAENEDTPREKRPLPRRINFTPAGR